MQARVDARLDRVILGNFGDCKNIGEGVFELRLAFGPGYRIYYGLDGAELVLLVAIKSPKQEISRPPSSTGKHTARNRRFKLCQQEITKMIC
jgi:putative addiction module killer protein